MTRVEHQIGGRKLEHDAPSNTFLLTNKIGGYLMLPFGNVSRYQGSHFLSEGRMFKVLDNISLVNNKNVRLIRNNFTFVQRERDNKLVEEFFMPHRFNAVVYSLNKPADVDLVFDAKESFDNRGYGRYYEVEKADDMMIVKFTKKTDRKEDRSSNKVEYEIYAVIISDNNKYKNIDKWIKTTYPFDKARNSKPFERYVWNGLRLLGAKNVVMAYGRSREEAVSEAKIVKRDLNKLIKNQNDYNHKNIKHAANEPELAANAAWLSLDGLTSSISARKSILAGLPWFFQFWARDELISLKAHMLKGEYEFVKDVLFKHLHEIQPDGSLLNIYPKSHIGSADAIGWLFKRVGDFIDVLERERRLGQHMKKEDMIYITRKLEHSITNMLKHHSHADLIVNKSKETWMDTIDRSGARIEIQCLFLNMYKLLRKLSIMIGDSFAEKLAERKEVELREKIKKHFWNGQWLADGIGDWTIRPNVFLAYYVYPDLLDRTEWVECFETVLSKTWLHWGGISTIDQRSDLFNTNHTGENSISYHNGDSWFYLNNIAAICMHSTSRFRFKKQTRSIIEASMKDVLWNGAVGHASEISSASKQDAFGCFSQAWSNATFVELIKEVYGF